MIINVKIYLALSVVLSICWPAKINAQHRISQEIENKIQSLVEKGNLPSLQVAVVDGDQVAWSRTFGKDTMICHQYKIGSIRKVITATAVLQLHEQGKLNIEDDVDIYLPFSVRHPGFPEIPVTIKMLLAHRSGLDMFRHQYEWDTRNLDYNKDTSIVLPAVVYLSEEDFYRASLDTLGSNFDPEVWKFTPGTNFQYSNTAYGLLGFLVENVSGQAYAEYVQENIFEPLGMHHSTFDYDDSVSIYPPAFTRNEGENISLPSWGGMYTTAEDMARLMIAFLHEGNYNRTQILQPGTIKLMHEKHSVKKSLLHPYSKCQFAGYGLGIIFYGKDWYGHGGSTIGYQSLWSFNKSSGKGYIILTNINGLCHGKENFDSVWGTVSSVEKLIKSELGHFSIMMKILILIIAAGIIVNILYFRKKIRI